MRTFLLQLRALVRLSFLELWRRNDVFGLLVFALALLVPLSTAKPFGAAGASRYLDEVALLLIWGFSLFISLGTGARLFPPEFASRTIYPLLARPISRGLLLVGKYLGAVASSWSALALEQARAIYRMGKGDVAAAEQAFEEARRLARKAQAANALVDADARAFADALAYLSLLAGKRGDVRCLQRCRDEIGALQAEGIDYVRRSIENRLRNCLERGNVKQGDGPPEKGKEL